MYEGSGGGGDWGHRRKPDAGPPGRDDYRDRDRGRYTPRKRDHQGRADGPPFQQGPGSPGGRDYPPFMPNKRRKSEAMDLEPGEISAAGVRPPDRGGNPPYDSPARPGYYSREDHGRSSPALRNSSGPDGRDDMDYRSSGGGPMAGRGREGGRDYYRSDYAPSPSFRGGGPGGPPGGSPNVGMGRGGPGPRPSPSPGSYGAGHRDSPMGGGFGDRRVIRDGRGRGWGGGQRDSWSRDSPAPPNNAGPPGNRRKESLWDKEQDSLPFRPKEAAAGMRRSLEGPESEHRFQQRDSNPMSYSSPAFPVAADREPFRDGKPPADRMGPSGYQDQERRGPAGGPMGTPRLMYSYNDRPASPKTLDRPVLGGGPPRPQMGRSGSSAMKDFKAHKYETLSDDEQQSPSQEGLSGSGSGIAIAESEEAVALPSKEDIVVGMDDLDMKINKAEKAIERLRKEKATAQTRKDVANMSLIERILVENQTRGRSNLKVMEHFNAIKKPAMHHTTVYKREVEQHAMYRPRMLQAMRKNLLSRKQKECELAEEYNSRKEEWLSRVKKYENLRPGSGKNTDNSTPARGLTTPTGVNRPRATRSKGNVSDAVHSEEEFEKIMQQIRQLESQDPNLRYLKTLARVPPMLLDRRSMERTFVDENRRVFDSEEEHRRFMLTNPWTYEEQRIFVTKYLLYPKQFKKISSFLENKSVEAVIEFYYQNKLRLGLKQLLRNSQARRKYSRSRTATERLVQSNSSFSPQVWEINQTCDYLYYPVRATYRPPSLVTAAIMAKNAQNDPKPKPQQLSSSGMAGKGALGAETPKSRGPSGSVKRSRSPRAQSRSPATQTPTTGGRSKSRKPQARSASRTRVAMTKRGSASMEVVLERPVEDDMPASWADYEVALLKEGMLSFGKDFKAIAEHVGSKNHFQCRNFFANYKSQHLLEQLIDSANTDKLRSGSGPAPSSVKQEAAASSSQAESGGQAESLIQGSEGAAGKAEESNGSELSEGAGEKKAGVNYWTKQEKAAFMKHLSEFGKDWEQLGARITTKTTKQIKNYFNNYKVKLDLEQLLRRREQNLRDSAEEIAAAAAAAAAVAAASPPDTAVPEDTVMADGDAEGASGENGVDGEDVVMEEGGAEEAEADAASADPVVEEKEAETGEADAADGEKVEETEMAEAEAEAPTETEEVANEASASAAAPAAPAAPVTDADTSAESEGQQAGGDGGDGSVPGDAAAGTQADAAAAVPAKDEELDTAPEPTSAPAEADAEKKPAAEQEEEEKEEKKEKEEEKEEEEKDEEKQTVEAPVTAEATEAAEEPPVEDEPMAEAAKEEEEEVVVEAAGEAVGSALVDADGDLVLDDATAAPVEEAGASAKVPDEDEEMAEAE